MQKNGGKKKGEGRGGILSILTLLKRRIQNILRDRVFARQDRQLQARQGPQERPQQRERVSLDLGRVASTSGLAARTREQRPVLDQQASHNFRVLLLDSCEELLQDLLPKRRQRDTQTKVKVKK